MGVLNSCTDRHLLFLAGVATPTFSASCTAIAHFPFAFSPRSISWRIASERLTEFSAAQFLNSAYQLIRYSQPVPRIFANGRATSLF